MPGPMVRRIVESIGQLLELVATIAFAIVFIGLFLAVMLRYLLNFPIVWSEELAGVAAAWMVFCGASVAVLRAEHITVDMFMRLPIYGGLLQRVHEALVCLAIIAFASALSVAGIRLCLSSWDRTLPALGWSYGALYGASALGGGMMALAALFRLLCPRHVRPAHVVGGAASSPTPQAG